MAFDPNNPTASGMVLTFDDEFNTLSLSADGAQDGTTWTSHLWYEPAGVHADVQNGVLNLYSDGASVNMTTVNPSQQGFTQKYGYFEARIYAPGGTGTWPAFWLISSDHAKDANLPASEIDIIEGQGASPDGYFGTVHSDSSHSGDQQNANNWIQTGMNISQGWHTYGLLWDEHSNNLTWYFDGKPVLTEPKFSTTDSSPMMVVLGNGNGNMDGFNPVTADTPNPSDMKVDWVHVYQFSDMNPVAVSDPNATSTASTDPSSTTSTDPSGTSAATTSADSTGSATAGSGSSTPTTTTTGPDTLTIHAAADTWQGDAQFVVLVDGHQVGGTQDVSASHDAGQWQDITLNGDFSNAHQVQIEFTNDAYGGSHSQDRNLYIGSITLDGHQVQGTAATSNTAAGGFQAMDPHSAVMVTNGTATFDVSGALATGTGSSTTGSATVPTDTTTPTTGSTAPTTGSTTPTTAASPVQTFSDGSGHDVFVFNSMSDAGATINDFHAGQDVLDLAPLLHAIGYTGSDPVADHVLQFTQDASGGTDVMIDPHGVDPSHGQTLVTLANVTPQDLSHSTWH